MIEPDVPPAVAGAALASRGAKARTTYPRVAVLGIDGLDPDAKPFGSTIGVVITFGGAVKTLRDDDDKAKFQEAFNPLEAENEFMRP